MCKTSRLNNLVQSGNWRNKLKNHPGMTSDLFLKGEDMFQEGWEILESPLNTLGPVKKEFEKCETSQKLLYLRQCYVKKKLSHTLFMIWR